MAAQDTLVETRHNVTIGGEVIRYTVTTGTIVLKEEAERQGEHAGESDGELARATVFFVAYTRDGVGEASARPIPHEAALASFVPWLDVAAARQSRAHVRLFSN